MVSASCLNLIVQIGHELRVELDSVLLAERIDALWFRSNAALPFLPEQRADDGETIQRRKAEALLRTVRIGAVRR